MLTVSNFGQDQVLQRSDAIGQPRVVSAGETARWIQDSKPLVDVELIAGVPKQMLHDYAEAAVRHARSQEIEPGQWFAEILGFQGLWGEGSTLEMAELDLLAAVPGWVELRIKAGGRVPELDGFDLNLRMAG